MRLLKRGDISNVPVIPKTEMHKPCCNACIALGHGTMWSAAILKEWRSQFCNVRIEREQYALASCAKRQHLERDIIACSCNAWCHATPHFVFWVFQSAVQTRAQQLFLASAASLLHLIQLRRNADVIHSILAWGPRYPVLNSGTRSPKDMGSRHGMRRSYYRVLGFFNIVLKAQSVVIASL